MNRYYVVIYNNDKKIEWFDANGNFAHYVVPVFDGDEVVYEDYEDGDDVECTLNLMGKYTEAQVRDIIAPTAKSLTERYPAEFHEDNVHLGKFSIEIFNGLDYAACYGTRIFNTPDDRLGKYIAAINDAIKKYWNDEAAPPVTDGGQLTAKMPEDKKHMRKYTKTKFLVKEFFARHDAAVDWTNKRIADELTAQIKNTVNNGTIIKEDAVRKARTKLNEETNSNMYKKIPSDRRHNFVLPSNRKPKASDMNRADEDDKY